MINAAYYPVPTCISQWYIRVCMVTGTACTFVYKDVVIICAAAKQTRTCRISLKFYSFVMIY